MTITFPPSVFFGTSTSAAQIETAVEHDWKGLTSRDGSVFDRTTDHECRLDEDVAIISSLAPNYRMSLMWSKLQHNSYGALDPNAVRHYHTLLQSLKGRGVDIMMVLYHWCNPLWFAKMGGWEQKEGSAIFLDYAKKIVNEFGHYVSYWNTFNEPNLYSVFSYGLGEFPPFAKDVFKSVTVMKNMAGAHEVITNYIKQKFPLAPCGYSQNTVVFDAENIAGSIPAKMADYWYMEYLPNLFSISDYVGLSYYARLCFDPFPITYLKTPEKFGPLRKHDDIWEYYPAGLDLVVKRYWSKYKKPIIITENGVCTKDDAFRQDSICDYMRILHRLLSEGVDVRGYYHWTAWDNFEWTLGPSYNFGLYSCDPLTMNRTRKGSADLYATLAHDRKITI
jgi:beta-glucosidase